jgi:hypothetical protein
VCSLKECILQTILNLDENEDEEKQYSVHIHTRGEPKETRIVLWRAGQL